MATIPPAAMILACVSSKSATPIVHTKALVPAPSPGAGTGRWSSPPLMPISPSSPVITPKYGEPVNSL